MASYQDKLASASARVRRKLFDHSVRMKGRQVSVLRFIVAEDIYADEQRTLISSGTIPAVLVYPHGEIPLQRFRAQTPSLPQAVVQDSGLFLFDILPVEVYTQWADKVEIGDFIFQVIKDEVGNKIGILLRVANLFGSWSSELVWRKGWAAPYSGDIPAEVESAITKMLT